MYGRDLCHTALQSGKGLITNAAAVMVKWEFTDGTAIYVWNPVVGDADGNGSYEVFAGDIDYYGYLLSGTTGASLWTYQGGECVHASGAIGNVDGGTDIEVILINCGTDISCLSGVDGSEKWHIGLTGGWAHSSPAICDVDSDGEMEVVVALTYPGNPGLVSLKGSDGSLEWCFPVMSFSSPAIADVDDDGTLEVLYVGSDSLYCIDGVSGNLEWGFPCLNGNLMSTPTLINVDGDAALEVFFGTYGDVFYSVDGETGLEEWSENVSDWIGYATPAAADLDSDGNVEVVFVVRNGWVHCRDGDTGGVEWDYNLGSSSRDADPSIADIDGDNSLEVIVMADGGNIHVIDGATGNLEWTYSGSGYHYVVPADVDGDGWLELVYVSNSPTRRVVCLDNIDVSIGLTGFNAIGKEGLVQISWSVEAGIDNYKWLIVRSMCSASGYEQIAELPTKVAPASYVWIDSLVCPGVLYYYKLGDVDRDGRVTWHGPVTAEARAFHELSLALSAKPNPFRCNEGVEIRYQVPGGRSRTALPVTLSIYNESGVLVRVLVDKSQAPKSHVIPWDGKDRDGKFVPSGTYFCCLNVDGKRVTRKIIIIK